MSLLLNAILFTLSFVIHVTSIGFITYIFQHKTQDMPTLIKNVSLAYVPLVFSFMTSIPYFGRGIGVTPMAYHLLALLTAVKETYQLSEAQTIATVVSGWLLVLKPYPSISSSNSR